jgi:Co/Zn/Cd efflux system component
MAHYQRALAAAVGLNTAISAVEAVAGFKSGSLSLIMDGAHNLSDEMALIFLYLAFILSQACRGICSAPPTYSTRSACS